MPLFKSFSLFTYIVLIGSSIVFYSCTDDMTPQQAADEFLTALADGEFDRAQLMVEKGSEKLIKTIEKTADQIEKGKSKITIVDQNGDEHSSIVKFKYDDSNKINSLRLKRDDGEDWSISINNDNGDLMVGDQTVEEILGDLDINIKEALTMSEAAIEDLVEKYSGGVLKFTGSILKQVGELMEKNGNGDIDIDVDSKDFENSIKKLAEDSDIDFEKAKEDLLKAVREISEAAKSKK